MISPVITFERLLTLARQPFDPESISVVIRLQVENDNFPWLVMLRDEGNQNTKNIPISKGATEAEIEDAMIKVATEMSLIPVDKNGNDTTD